MLWLYMLAYISFSVGCRFICSKVYQSRSYDNSTILTLLLFINLPLGDWGKINSNLNMKKIFLLFALFSTMFMACSDDDDEKDGDDGGKSENVVKVGEKTYKVYGIDAYYLQDLEQFVIGFYLHEKKLVNNDIYFAASDFNLNSIAKDKVYQVNRYMDMSGKEQEANSFDAFINDLHDNTEPLYSKAGSLKVLEYDAQKRQVTMEFDVAVDGEEAVKVVVK